MGISAEKNVCFEMLCVRGKHSLEHYIVSLESLVEYSKVKI